MMSPDTARQLRKRPEWREVQQHIQDARDSLDVPISRIEQAPPEVMGATVLARQLALDILDDVLALFTVKEDFSDIQREKAEDTGLA